MIFKKYASIKKVIEKIMYVILFKGYWNKEDVIKYKNAIFIFGDNNIGMGAGGQAIIRGYPNAFGIPTKKYPNNNPGSFYSDHEFAINKQNIDKAIEKIKGVCLTGKYTTLFLPADGLGTGLAKLPTVAPITYKYLCEQVKKLEDFVRSLP